MGEAERQIDEETGLEIIDEDGVQDEEQVLGETDAEQQEAYARRMGWVPKDEYRGDPDNWISAEEFIAKGENELPVLRERLRKQDSQLQEMHKELRDVVRKQGERDRKIYERVRADLEAERLAAVEEADTDKYQQVTKKIEQLDKEAPQEQDSTQVPDPVWDEWKSKNDWYGTNEAMTKYANSVSTFVKEQGDVRPGTREFLDAVRKEVQQRFPDKFENPRRSRGNAVEGARGPRGGSGKPSYQSLPPEAKEACDRYLRKGWVKSKEEYVKHYFDEANQ